MERLAFPIFALFAAVLTQSTGGFLSLCRIHGCLSCAILAVSRYERNRDCADSFMGGWGVVPLTTDRLPLTPILEEI